MTAGHWGKAAGMTGAALSSPKLVASGRSPRRQKKRHLGSSSGGQRDNGASASLNVFIRAQWSRGSSVKSGVEPT